MKIATAACPMLSRERAALARSIDDLICLRVVWRNAGAAA